MTTEDNFAGRNSKVIHHTFDIEISGIRDKYIALDDTSNQ